MKILMGVCAALLMLTVFLWTRWDRAAAHAERAEVRATQLLVQQESDQKMIDLQATVLANQQKQMSKVTEIERRMRLLDQSLNRQAAVQAKAIKELKTHDQATDSWLRAVAPVALGRLYQRSSTNDPATYRQGDAVPPGTVPPPRKAADGDQ